MVKIATVNVNGIRAAARKGMDEWLRATSPDILCLQEVRAPGEELRKLAEGDGPLAGGWKYLPPIGEQSVFQQLESRVLEWLRCVGEDVIRVRP